MVEQHKAVIRRLVDEAWNQRAFDVLDELFAADAVIHDNGIPFPSRGPICAREGISAICTAFPDIRVIVDDLFAEGDKVAVRWSSRGTHQSELEGIAPTHRQVTVTGIAIYRFAEGRIVEEWMNTDTLGMLRQLGVIPWPVHTGAPLLHELREPACLRSDVMKKTKGEQ